MSSSKYPIPDDDRDKIEMSLDHIAATADLLQLLASEEAIAQINLITLPSLGRMLEVEAAKIRTSIQKILSKMNESPHHSDSTCD